MNSGARDRILGRVRTALAGVPDAAAPPPRIVLPQITEDEKLESFCAALEKLNGNTHQAASTRYARAYTERLLSGNSAVASNAPILAAAGITSLPGVQSNFNSVDLLRNACASAALGITSADYALADTGTLVMLSSQEEARMISLLPPAHLAIVPRDRLLSGLDELFTILPKPAARSSSMVFITGPSRTADIEQILVRGVHGPGEVHVVFL